MICFEAIQTEQAKNRKILRILVEMPQNSIEKSQHGKCKNIELGSSCTNGETEKVRGSEAVADMTGVFWLYAMQRDLEG